MLLAIDTSTSQIGIALLNGNNLLAEFIWSSKVRHTVELAPSVMEILAKTGVEIDQLQAIGVAIGPGSFTSLRVGLSFVKGLAFARNIPVAGIHSLDILAAGVPQHSGQAMICSLPAGRGRHAAGWYKKNHKNQWIQEGEPRIFSTDDLAAAVTSEVLLCGELGEDERTKIKQNSLITLLDPAFCVRRPALLASLAAKKIKKSQGDDPITLAPYYLHIANPIPTIQ